MRLLLVTLVLTLAGCQYDPFTAIYTQKQPKGENLAGVYFPDVDTKKLIAEQGRYSSTDVSITLAPDGTITIKNIPDWWLTDGKPQGGTDSGRGTWIVQKHQQWWVVSTDFCSTEQFASPQHRVGRLSVEMFLTGEQAPYKIRLTIGDPDEGQGMVFERVSSKAL